MTHTRTRLFRVNCSLSLFPLLVPEYSRSLGMDLCTVHAEMPQHNEESCELTTRAQPGIRALLPVPQMVYDLCKKMSES